MKIKLILTTAIFVFFASVALAQVKTPAFPGAEGGGMYASGGRGGTVYYVNTLEDNDLGNNDTKEGSLRWCLSKSGKKMILFKVSGVIKLKKALEIKGDVTIAGQTATGGICLRDHQAVVKGNNVIIRFMRFRPGNDYASAGSDGIWGRYLENIILDHCAMGWAVDECASFYSSKNFTMQWCILHEGLMDAGHPKGVHSFGGLWGGFNASFHHNLLIHNLSRNPRFNGYKRSGLSYNNPQPDEIMDFRNNVIYNWGDNSGYGGEAAGKYNVVNNYYRPGPGTSAASKGRIVQIDRDKQDVVINPAYGIFHVSGNVMHDNSWVTNDNRNGITNYSWAPLEDCTTATPFEYTPVATHTAEEALEKVLGYAGASHARDIVEKRLVNEVKTGTTTYKGSKTNRNGLIDTPADAEGWAALTYTPMVAPIDTDGDGIPDDWEDAHGLDKNNPADGILLNEEGYTNLEVYINSLVKHITDAQARGGDSIDPELSDKVTLLIQDNTIYVQAKQIDILSLDGKFVSSVRNVESLYLGNLGKGIYIIKVQDLKGNVVTHKIIR